MEDIIFEQDYTRYEKTPETERAEAIFNQAIDGGFFKAWPIRQNFDNRLNHSIKIEPPPSKYKKRP